jgi:hypothetical protein
VLTNADNCQFFSPKTNYGLNLAIEKPAYGAGYKAKSAKCSQPNVFLIFSKHCSSKFFQVDRLMKSTAIGVDWVSKAKSVQPTILLDPELLFFFSCPDTSDPGVGYRHVG